MSHRRPILAVVPAALSIALTLTLTFILTLVSLTPSAGAATSYVDGISDQSLPVWDGGFEQSYFASLFDDTWVHGPGAHVAFARYVVQWNAIAESEEGKSEYLGRFESWLRDVAEIGLIPDVALTSYTGVYPSSPGEYQAQLEELLDQAQAIGHPIHYLEAWNEPNGQGSESAANAAHFTNSASATCEDRYGCTVIAGDFEDSPTVAAYEDEYIDDLDFVLTNWGVHPYYSVEEESEAPFQNVREHLPNKGVGEQIWFTEIAARKCSDFDGRLVDNGEVGQAQRANWLVNTLMENVKPEHVFYYELLLGERRQPACQSEGSDSALYTPSGDPAEPDRPRPAASYIWGGATAPLGYGGAFMANSAQATLTGGAEL